jgi:hypothetical protein
MATSSSGSPNDGRAAGKSGAGGKKSKVLLRFRSQNHCGKSESPPLRSGELFQQTARAEAVAPSLEQHLFKGGPLSCHNVGLLHYQTPVAG